LRKISAAPKEHKGALGDALRSLAAMAAAVLLCEILLRFGVGEPGISAVMILAVFAVSAVSGGYAYGFAAAFAAAFLHDFLFIEPRFAVKLSGGFFINLSVMLIVAIVSGAIVERIIRRSKDARGKEQQAEFLYEINRKLLSSKDEIGVARYTMEYLRNYLHRSVAVYTSLDDWESESYYFRRAEGDAASQMFSRPEELWAAQLAYRRREAVGVGFAVGGAMSACYLPVMTQGEIYAVLGISCRTGPIPSEDMPFVYMVAEQAAQALKVQDLTRQQRETLVMAETEQARNRFLRGISHDLRTPLTSIIGASSTFLENQKELSAGTQAQLVKGIQSDSQWLLSMVENILSVTRISQSDMKIAKTEEAAEEIVGEAVAVFRKRYPGVEISIRPPEEFLLVPMDALLITQVINNLLENTQRHSGENGARVEILFGEKDGFAEISVEDTGPGISPEVLPTLFEIRPVRAGHGQDSSRGLGIGLSICKTIVEAHGGWIKGENLPQGGAGFTFALPISKEEDNYGD
jgi:two-component system sensor histidine kinase KdpD